MPSRSPTTDIPVIAPIGFVHEAVSENIIAGPAMLRRGSYMYGDPLSISATGHVDTGLGKQVIFGSTSILQPTVLIDQPQQSLAVDGVEIEFFNMPGSEAPSELTFYLPQWKAFCGAEVVSHVMHNVLTLRGAKVRDALFGVIISVISPTLSNPKLRLRCCLIATTGQPGVMMKLLPSCTSNRICTNLPTTRQCVWPI